MIGPKNGKTIAKNHIGITTGNLAAVRLLNLLHSRIPIAFYHMKYKRVHANPKVVKCKKSATMYLVHVQESSNSIRFVSSILIRFWISKHARQFHEPARARTPKKLANTKRFTLLTK